MRINTGKFRGRVIPFVNAKFDNADISPQKIREALFSMIGDGIENSCFLDLFTCSGQIGLEALSRGAGMVVFNDIDRKRSLFVKLLLEEWKADNGFAVYNYHYERCLRYLNSREMVFNHIFLDPPYPASGSDLYKHILSLISRYRILDETGTVYIQHSRSVTMCIPDEYSVRMERVYGRNKITVISSCQVN